MQKPGVGLRRRPGDACLPPGTSAQGPRPALQVNSRGTRERSGGGRGSAQGAPSSLGTSPRAGELSPPSLDVVLSQGTLQEKVEENPLLEMPACTKEPQGHPHCPKPPSVPGAPMAAADARGGGPPGAAGGAACWQIPPQVQDVGTKQRHRLTGASLLPTCETTG